MDVDTDASSSQNKLNPIERCWAQWKRYTRAYCNYNITSLRRNINPGLDSVSLENIRNYFRRVRNYIFGNLLGNKAGIELEELINIVSQATPITKRKGLVKLAYST